SSSSTYGVITASKRSHLSVISHQSSVSIVRHVASHELPSAGRRSFFSDRNRGASAGDRRLCSPPLQRLIQLPPAAADPRHHGPDRDRQHLRDFRVRKLFHVP